MKIHLCSESFFLMKETGVHTGAVDCIEMLKEAGHEVIINGEPGKGDIFHSHTYGPWHFFKSIGYKGRRVFTVHVIPDSIKGSLPAWKLFYPFIKWYFKKVYSHSDVCIAISPMVKEAIIATGAKTKIVEIGNPIPVDRWKRTKENRKLGRELLGVKDNEFLVLGVGQIQPRKGVEDFVKVASLVPGAKFRWVGGKPFGESLTAGLQPDAQKIANSIEDRFKFAGMFPLEKMPMLYAAGDLLLFTSYQENCPLVPIEAAASGMPVIYRHLPEYDALYQTEYIKGKTNEEFAGLVSLLAKDKKQYRHALKLSEGLVQQFDKEAVLKQLESVYGELIKNV